MKVFWSWQSDTPGKIGRHFVREALEAAIKALNEEVEVEEPEREIHLDHDRKGVSGSPDLASTILEKIKATSIFVADVTPVGTTLDRKALINSNVAIELGFALAHVGDQFILMVLNNHYGNRETLPFDLKHKAGPIIFSLQPEASNQEIKSEQSSLSGKLKTAIRDCLEALNRKSNKETSKHIETECVGNSAKYFDYGEALAERKYSGGVLRVAYDSGPLLYLRVIPGSQVKPLKRNEAKDIAFGIKIEPLNNKVGKGASWDLNSYGAITFTYPDFSENGKVFTTSQIFLNREIWGLDTVLLHGSKSIPIRYVEEVFEYALRHYLYVAEHLLQLRPPIVVEAGAAEVRGSRMILDNNYFRQLVHDNEIKSRHVLNNFEKQTVDAILLAIFEDFFDAAGEKRPVNFRGFPG
jgi:hypothetical protein